MPCGQWLCAPCHRSPLAWSKITFVLPMTPLLSPRFVHVCSAACAAFQSMAQSASGTFDVDEWFAEFAGASAAPSGSEAELAPRFLRAARDLEHVGVVQRVGRDDLRPRFTRRVF